MTTEMTTAIASVPDIESVDMADMVGDWGECDVSARLAPMRYVYISVVILVDGSFPWTFYFAPAGEITVTCTVLNYIGIDIDV